jgi:hypothetical protein
MRKYILLVFTTFSISCALGQDTLTASPKEKLLFSLNFRAMNYWHATSRVLEKESAVKDSVIDLFQRKTGVYQNNIKLMEQSFALKEGIAAECLPELIEAKKQLDIYRPRSHRRGVVIAVGIPASLLIGFGTGMIYQSLK